MARKLDAPKHLYYSRLAEDRAGYGIFETTDGRQVRATAAVSDPNYLETDYKWPDARYLGVGVAIIESHSRGLLSVAEMETILDTRRN